MNADEIRKAAREADAAILRLLALSGRSLLWPSEMNDLQRASDAARRLSK